MWDTVAWNYRLHRRLPEFSYRKVSVVVRDGSALISYGGKITEVSDGDETIGGVRVVVSCRGHMVFFIIGRVSRRKLTSYIAGVSCHDQLVTTQVIQAVVDWTKEKTNLRTPPEDEAVTAERVVHEHASPPLYIAMEEPIIQRGGVPRVELSSEEPSGGHPINRIHYTSEEAFGSVSQRPDIVWTQMSGSD